MEAMSPTVIDERKYSRLLEKTLPVVIETEAEYERMLAAIEELMDRDDDGMTPENGRLLKLLAMLVEEYEDRNYPLPPCKPHRMLKHLMDERGLKPRDLWNIIGLKSRVSEILSGKRAISKDQAKKLAAFFRVPVDLFI